MVWPWIVVDAVVDLRVGVTGAFGSELPDAPVGPMFVVEEFDELVERVSVGALRVVGGRTRRCDDYSSTGAGICEFGETDKTMIEIAYCYPSHSKGPDQLQGVVIGGRQQSAGGSTPKPGR